MLSINIQYFELYMVGKVAENLTYVQNNTRARMPLQMCERALGMRTRPFKFGTFSPVTGRVNLLGQQQNIKQRYNRDWELCRCVHWSLETSSTVTRRRELEYRWSL